MSCKARQAMNNECVARLLAQCPPSWAGAVEQKPMCYNITKSLGTGKVVRGKLRSTKKSMVHSACSWWWTPWVLIENEEFSRACAQTFTNHFKQAAARSSTAQPTGAGVQEARTPLRQLGDKSDNDIPENPLQARISVGISNRRSPARDRHKISEFCFISGNVSSWSLAAFQLAEPASVTRRTFDLMLAARCANTHAWAWMTWFCLGNPSSCSA